ncbi:MAG: anti-anti-sigma factor [Myxococcales bacterium]|nr:anti-anti-sigma factor [Myxococcales bacterium]
MFPKLADLEVGLELSAIPTWVLRREPLGIVWANEPGVAFWQAESLAELRARDIAEGAPKVVLERTWRLFDDIRGGKRVREEWAFFPRGRAVTVSLDVRAVLLADEQPAMLAQAVPLSDASDDVQRSVAMFRHTVVMAALLRDDGHIWSQNPAAKTMFGERERWLDWLVDRERGQALLAEVLREEQGSALLEVDGESGRRWHVVDARCFRDPVTGTLGVLVTHRDETSRVEAEQLADSRGQRIDDLSTALELVERQRREILELSAPLLDVGDQTLAVPIIGRFDGEQSAALTARLLDAVGARGVRRVILDLTGVAGLDGDSTLRLQQLLAALRLLGAMPVITGIRPASSLALSRLDLDLHGVTTLRSLAAGLRLPRL